MKKFLAFLCVIFLFFRFLNLAKADFCGCYPGDGRCEWDSHCSQEGSSCPIRHCNPEGCDGQGLCSEQQGYCWRNPDDGQLFCVGAPSEVCGNGSCGSGEDSSNCCQDCGTPCGGTCSNCPGGSCFCPDCVSNVTAVE